MLNVWRAVMVLTALVMVILFSLEWQDGGSRVAARDGLHPTAGAGSLDGLWGQAGQVKVRGEFAVPKGARRVRLEAARLLERLLMAPLEREGRRRASLPEVSLPLPDGRYARFLIEESPAMEAELAASHPEIRSYHGVAADGSGATMRGDWSPRGFHATVIAGSETFLIHPVAYGDDERRAGDGDYFSYSYSDQEQRPEDLLCDGPIVPMSGAPELPSTVRRVALQSGETLKTFRIALATTQEFTNASGLGGGSISGTLAALNTLVNSLNTVYEREVAIRFVLAANNTQVIFTAEPDPFTNTNNSTMLQEVRSVMRDRIGNANFDLGLVIGTAGGGVAYLGVVCNNVAGDSFGLLKGGGVGSASPSGPVTRALFVMAHEIGHMFRAYHSFNSSCSGNRSGNEAWESGSGLTIMSYAGGCSQPITNSAELRFHGGSLTSIRSFATTLGCPTNTPTGNQMPTVDAGPGYTIPKNTPFVLTATASDPDAADQPNLTYAWEQYDAGGSLYANPPYIDSADSSGTTRPIFRPFPISQSSQRIFPSLSYILGYANDPPDMLNGLQTAEELPRVGRLLNFIVTVRDMRGGVATDTTTLTVSDTAGPFLVTSPNGPTTWVAGTTQTVQWSAANTGASPVNCSTVRILLSSDGGVTFPVTLVASAPNTGTASFLVPAVASTSSARIRVEAVNNVFFDISDANFAISSSASCAVTVNPATIAGGAVNTAYSQSLTQSGLTGTVTWSVTGTLPAGLSLGATTGILAGTPTQQGSFTIVVRATGSNGCFGERSYQLVIGCTAATVNPATIAGGAVNTAYSQSLTQSGLTGLVTWSVTGTLPAGLSLGATTGILAGTPTQQGSFTIVVRATGSNGCFGERSYQLVIGCRSITITPMTISQGMLSRSYNLYFTVTGISGKIYWTRTGSLPSGMNFDTNAGLLFGAPSVTGTWTFTITAADSNGCNHAQSYNLVITSTSVTTYEGDVTPRPNGNGAVDSTDFVQAGRFAVGLESPMQGDEFQRADTSPIGTLGNSQIDAADWVQTGRYATGLDSLRSTSGQTAAVRDRVIDQPEQRPHAVSTIRVIDAAVVRGAPGTIDLELDAVGIENALVFTLRFDPEKFLLTRVSANPGTLIINRMMENEGKVGIGLALSPGESFSSGSQRLLTLQFVRRDSGDSAIPEIRLDDSLVRRQMVSTRAVHLPPPRLLPDPVIGSHHLPAGNDQRILCKRRSRSIVLVHSNELIPGERGAAHDYLVKFRHFDEAACAAGIYYSVADCGHDVNAGPGSVECAAGEGRFFSVTCCISRTAYSTRGRASPYRQTISS